MKLLEYKTGRSYIKWHIIQIYIVVNAVEKRVNRMIDIFWLYTYLFEMPRVDQMPRNKEQSDVERKNRFSQVHVSDFNLILTLILKVSACILAIDLLSVTHRRGKSWRVRESSIQVVTWILTQNSRNLQYIYNKYILN